jgi:iron complex outermembrane receptor protein
MSDRWINRVLMVAAIAVLLVLAVPALAQETAEEPDESQMTEEEKAIDEALKRQPFAGEITVTSRRREEALQEIPLAVSVIAGAQLEDVAASAINELAGYVPNLSIYQGRNQSTTLTAFVRGVGQADPLWGVDPGVGLYIDDVYVARPQGALLDVYDVERVEVLRGPQGTLYGKNTIGGAIKYVTKPLSDTPDGRITWNPGTFGTQEIRATIGGPIVTGKLRGKASFAKLTRDGYGENLYQNREVSNKDTTAYRLALEWLPSDKVSIRADYDRTEDNAEPVGLTRLQDNPLCWAFLGEGCPPYDNLFDTESGLNPLNSTDSSGYSLTLTWDINPAWRFKSITAYRETESLNSIDFDTTPATIIDTGPAFYFDDQTTQEFQLVYTGSGKVGGVVGLYYFDGTAGGTVNANFFGSTFSTTDGDIATKSYALYADASIRLSDRLTLNLGIRPTRETKDGRAFNYFSSTAEWDDVILVLADFEDSVTFTSWAPKIGLDYQFNPDVMGYFKVNRGFKSGGYNVRAQSTFFPDSALPFDDEVMTVAELGVKSVLANRSLVLNGAVFYGDYTDIQVSTFTSYDSTGDGIDDAFFGNFLNAGDATISGVELEYNWASKSWFGLSGFLAYLKTDPDFLDEDDDGFVDAQVITNAPELTGAIRGNFDFPAFGGLITASVGYSYRDDSMLTNEGGPDPNNPTEPLLPIVQPAFGMLDAWVSWLSGNAKWRFGISGKNLTDEEYLTNGYNLAAFGILQGSYGAPRTFIATLEWRFF